MAHIPMQAKKCNNGQIDILMDKLGPQPTQCQETPIKMSDTQRGKNPKKSKLTKVNKIKTHCGCG